VCIKEGIARMEKLPKFDEMVPSTITMMVYSNLTFSLTDIFSGIEVNSGAASYFLTTRKNNIDKKTIKAPYGVIISTQNKDRIRGLDLRKVKKEKKKKSKKIDFFRNQLMIWIVLENNVLLNVMIFNNCLKLAGCRDEKSGYEAVMLLWEEYIRPNKSWWKIRDGPWKNDGKVYFLSEMVMRNVDFQLGFSLNRASLNSLMNEKKYKDIVALSQYESTVHTNVNIQLFSETPKNFKYTTLVYDPKKTKPYFILEEKNRYGKRKGTKKKFTTFIVFSTSEVILTGRYIENMRKAYEFFIKTVMSHRKSLEEKIVKKKEEIFIDFADEEDEGTKD